MRQTIVPRRYLVIKITGEKSRILTMEMLQCIKYSQIILECILIESKIKIILEVEA